MFSLGVSAQGVRMDLHVPIRNYPADEYDGHGQVWSIAEGVDGRMYFGTGGGLLIYDGVGYEKIQVANRTTIRSLRKGIDDQIFIGAQGEIGFVGKDSLGGRTYNSLMQYVDSLHEKFRDVWSISYLDGKVYFHTDPFILVWDGEAMRYIHCSGKRTFLYFTYNFSEEILVHEYGYGLQRIQRDSLVLLEGGDQLKRNDIHFIHPRKEGGYIIGTKAHGLKLLFKGVVTEIEKGTSYFKKNMIYHGTGLSNGNILVATISDGIVEVSPQGELLSKVDKYNGLMGNNVWYLFKSSDQTVWAGLNSGFAHIFHPKKVQFLDPETKLDGWVTSIFQKEKEILITSQAGFYQYKQGKVSKFSFSKDQNWEILPWKNGKDEVLLANNRGVHLITANGLKEINPGFSQDILESSAFPGRLYSSKADRIIYQNYKMGRWQSPQEATVVSKNQDDYRFMIEDTNGDLWVASRFNGVYKFSFKDSIEQALYDSVEGLRDKKDLYITKLFGQIVATHTKGIDFYNPSKNIFEQNEAFEKAFNRDKFPRSVYRALESSDGRLWIYSADSIGEAKLECYTHEDGVFTLVEDHYAMIPKMLIFRMLEGEDGKIWICGGKGLYRFDAQIKIQEANVKTQITNVIIGKDSIVSKGKEIKNHVDFEYNAMGFQFSLPRYHRESENLYRYRLFGFDDNWSQWSKSTGKEYTYLREGSYRFEVESKDIYGKVYPSAQYSFIINAPWYRQTLAYVLYLIVLLIIIYMVVKLNSRRLEKENLRLEGIVAERTLEIREKNSQLESVNEEIRAQSDQLKEANDNLEVLNAEVTKKNKHIMESIEYAKFIQEAILPDTEFRKNLFKKHMVFFRPKEQVSGDFYWVYEVDENHIIWAAADCTGHGVPGAMMSMICNGALNTVVIDNGIREPSEILDKTRQEIIDTLNSRGGDSRKDGMDIALCMLDRRNLQLKFSGAYNPLYILRGEEVLEYKADSMPVSMYLGDEKYFSQEIIQLEPGDRIYTFSDGYMDQLGGKRLRSMGKKRFQKILLDHQDKSFEILRENLNKAFDNWRKDFQQVDDVCVFAVEV